MTETPIDGLSVLFGIGCSAVHTAEARVQQTSEVTRTLCTATQRKQTHIWDVDESIRLLFLRVDPLRGRESRYALVLETQIFVPGSDVEVPLERLWTGEIDVPLTRTQEQRLRQELESAVARLLTRAPPDGPTIAGSVGALALTLLESGLIRPTT